MRIFDVSYRHSFLGSCSVYLAQAKPSETPAVLEWIRLIGQTTIDSIIIEMLNARVHEALQEFIIRVDIWEENKECIAQAFIALANMMSDCEKGVKEVTDGPLIEKVMDKAAKWAAYPRVCKGFMQFVCGMTSVKYLPLRAFIKTNHLDIATMILNDRAGDERAMSITDCLTMIEFMTDAREDEDEKPFASVILYCLDKGVYQICFEGLADDSICIRLRVLCARVIGNAITLSNYPNIESVGSPHQENFANS